MAKRYDPSLESSEGYSDT